MSWNVSLVSKIAAVTAAEASAIGVDAVFAPVVNMMQDPRFGRLQEGFGENPIIASHMGRAATLALQGGAGNATTYLPDGHVVSLGKHFGACECCSPR
jgi:beta-glucosidase